MFESLENGIGLSIVEFLQEGWWGDLFWYLLYPFNFIGSEMGLLLILPVIYWSVNKQAGTRLFILVLAGSVLSGGLKSWWQRPRPFHVAPGQIRHITTTTEFGLPSGHTIFGTVTALWIINYFRKQKITVVMICFLLLMGISRMIHGMHFPQDVVSGWLLGLLFFGMYYYFEPVLVKTFGNITWGKGLLIFAVFAGIIFFLTVGIFKEYETRKSILSPTGALTGGLLGIIFEERFISFTTKIQLRFRLIRAASGIVILLAVYILLDLGFYVIFENDFSIAALGVYTLRYMLVGSTVTFFIPAIFKKTKI